MSYSQDLPLVRVDVSPEFEFFDDGSVVHTSVTPSLTGTRSIRRGKWWGDVIKGTRPLFSGYQRSFTLPVVEASGWVGQDGEPHGAWSYDVEVYVTAPDRSPVLWSGSISPTSSSPVTITPVGGTIASEVATGSPSSVNTVLGGLNAGGGGSASITPDPSVAGAYLIGE